MFENFENIIKFNKYLFNKQSKAIFIFLILILLIKYFVLNVDFSSKHNLLELQVSLNDDNIEKLITVPYIGEKTAIKIIELKFKNEFITKKDLKSFRNYKKFQFYIKN